jgi:hypothetical protein
MRIYLMAGLVVLALSAGLFYSVRQIGELKATAAAAARDYTTKIEAANQSVGQWQQAAKNTVARTHALDVAVTEALDQDKADKQKHEAAMAALNLEVARLTQNGTANCLLDTVDPAVDQRLRAAETTGTAATAAEPAAPVAPDEPATPLRYR